MRFFSLIALTAFFAARAASLEPDVSYSVAWGDGDHQIGRQMTGEKAFWAPSMFDVDDSDNVYIPDFYKQRIAIIGPNSVWKGFITCAELGPQLRYFQRTTDGWFLVLNDQSLTMHDPSGKRIGQIDLDITTLKFVYANAKQVYVVNEVKHGTNTLVLDRALVPTSHLSIPVKGGVVGPFQGRGDKFWSRTIGELNLYGTPTNVVPAIAQFLFADALGSSLWGTTVKGFQELWKLSPQGKLISSDQLRWETSFQTDGYWSAVDSRWRLYKLFFADEGLSIQRYKGL